MRSETHETEDREEHRNPSERREDLHLATQVDVHVLDGLLEEESRRWSGRAELSPNSVDRVDRFRYQPAVELEAHHAKAGWVDIERGRGDFGTHATDLKIPHDADDDRVVLWRERRR